MNRREFLATSAATILPLRPGTGFRRSAGRLGPLACMPQREAGAVRRTGAGAKGKFARSECWAFPDILPVLRR